MDIFEQRAIELNWTQVCSIISKEIEAILRLHVQCKAHIVEDSYWNVTFINYRLPLSKLCQLVQATQPTTEDWEDALPDDGNVDVNDIGMGLAEKLLARHLGFTWEHHLITEHSLWLIGAAKDACARTERGMPNLDNRVIQSSVNELAAVQHCPVFDGERPECVEIYWQDLTPAKQSEILQIFGENGNWDVFPIATIEVPTEDKTFSGQ